MQCRKVKGAQLVFDSAQIPGEIIDMMVVRSDAPETLKKALVGAWYETMAAMVGPGKDTALAYMADLPVAALPSSRPSSAPPPCSYTAAEAAAFSRSEQLKKTMEYVRSFSFDHGLYGDADSKDFVGISFPDGTVMGNKSNIKLRFDAGYMQMAADGKL